MFVEGVPIRVGAVAFLTGAVTNVAFYGNDNVIGHDATPPFGLLFTNAAVGTHDLVAVASDDQGHSLTSAVTRITVIPNMSPTVLVTEPANGAVFLVGSTVFCRGEASDAETQVVRLDFYLDGTPFVANTFVYPTVRSTFSIGDVTAGAHTLSAVAMDNLGASRTNTTCFLVTNPPGVTFLITNSSRWNYLVVENDPGTAWRERYFDDSGWSNGLAELGYGDAGDFDHRPERTLISRGPMTTHFRKEFVVQDPDVFTNLIVQLLRDDGGVVYLNGTEVFRSNMTNGPITHLTEAPSQPFDDGTVYVQTNVNPSVLVPGTNVVAVEIHQSYVGGTGEATDISFDLMLSGQPGEPALTITRISAAELDIAWPFPSAGYSLESKPHLGVPTWTLVPEPDHPTNGFHHVTVGPEGDARFWRLHRP